MPKGSKKRKAVKKKAHHNHNHNHHDDASHSSHNNTYGDEDLKQHEDKESDSEDVNSPTSQDNPNSQLDLTDGEKEERKKVDDRSHTPSSSEDGQSVDESKVHPEVVPIADEEGGVHVDHELKPTDQSNGKTENVESVSTDSDLFQRPDEGCADSDVTGVDELKGDNSPAMVVEPVNESGNVYLEKSSSDESLVIEKPAVSVEDAPLINLDEAVNSLSEVAPPETRAILVGEKSSVIEENGSVTEVDKVALPDEKANGDDIASAASVMITDVTVPGIIENGEKEKEAILLDRNYLASDPVNLASENKGEEVVAKTDIVAPSDPNLSASPLTEGNLMLPKNAPRTEAGNHVDSIDSSAEQKNDIEVSESSISQPLLAARPQPRTSWMSCCGLFEAFGGSSR